MVDFMNTIKNLSAMKAKAEALQAEMEAARFDGQAGDGAVQVLLNGKFQLISVQIAPALLSPEAASTLEGFLLEAHARARQAIEQRLRESMGAMAGGLGLPPGLTG